MMSPPMDPFNSKDFQTVNLAGIEDSVLETDQPIGLAYVHYEVTLAVLMKDRILGLMEIGVSKNSYWSCTVFLAAYSGKDAGADIVVLAFHSKTYLNSTIDLVDTFKVLATVRQQMDDQVRKVFCHWPKSMDDHRRSDSGAESSEEHRSTVSAEEKASKYLAMAIK